MVGTIGNPGTDNNVLVLVLDIYPRTAYRKSARDEVIHTHTRARISKRIQKNFVLLSISNP